MKCKYIRCLLTRLIFDVKQRKKNRRGRGKRGEGRNWERGKESRKNKARNTV